MNSATLPLYRHFCEDVEICCSGSVVRAHKIILAANSGYFQGLFSFNKTNNEAKHLDRINLEVPWTSCMSSVESIINSFYGTRIILNPANIQSFIQAADFLLVPSVINLCTNFLQDYICRSTVVKTMELSRMYSLVEVEKACMFYILNNFSDVCEEEDFTEIPGSVLINLLEDTRLSATNEIFVLNAALRWIEACRDPAVQFLKVISKVRFLLLDETEYITVCDRCLEFANKYNIIPELHLFFREISELVWYKSGYESPRAEFLNPYFSIPRVPQHILFSIGGFSGQAPSSAIDVYDIRSNRWRRVDFSLPVGIAYPSAEVHKDKIYLVGGVMQPNHQQPQEFSNLCFSVNIGSKRVEPYPGMLEKRNFVTSAVVNNTLYALGGKPDPGVQIRLNSCEQLNLKDDQPKWKHISPMVHSRSDAGTAVLNDKIYVIGGFSGETSLRSVEVYNTNTNAWSTAPPLNIKRAGVSCVELGGRIYALGGNDGGERLSSVERYSPLNNRWELMSPMLCSRSNFGVGVVEGKIIVFGGYDGNHVTRTTEIYHPDLDEWREGCPMLYPTSGMATAVVQTSNISSFLQEDYCYDRKHELLMENRNKTSTDRDVLFYEDIDSEDYAEEEEEDLFYETDHEDNDDDEDIVIEYEY